MSNSMPHDLNQGAVLLIPLTVITCLCRLYHHPYDHSADLMIAPVIAARGQCALVSTGAFFISATAFDSLILRQRSLVPRHVAQAFLTIACAKTVAVAVTGHVVGSSDSRTAAPYSHTDLLIQPLHDSDTARTVGDPNFSPNNIAALGAQSYPRRRWQPRSHRVPARRFIVSEQLAIVSPSYSNWYVVLPGS